MKMAGDIHDACLLAGAGVYDNLFGSKHAACMFIAILEEAFNRSLSQFMAR